MFTALCHKSNRAPRGITLPCPIRAAHLAGTCPRRFPRLVLLWRLESETYLFSCWELQFCFSASRGHHPTQSDCLKPPVFSGQRCEAKVDVSRTWGDKNSPVFICRLSSSHLVYRSYYERTHNRRYFCDFWGINKISRSEKPMFGYKQSALRLRDLNITTMKRLTTWLLCMFSGL